ncbi:MAG: minichromosome maintenance protein MCM [archaeon]
MTISDVSRFEEFFKEKYLKEFEKLSESGSKSIYVDFHELEKFDSDLADSFIANPSFFFLDLEDAVKNLGIVTLTGKRFVPKVRFYNLPQDTKVSIRDLNSNYVGKLICTEGVITKITDVKPKIKVARYKCKNCGKIYDVKQEDANYKLVEPFICECEKRNFELLKEECIWGDTQKAEIQEPLEILKGGEQAKKITLWIEDDLTNKFIPGDKIEVIGILKLSEQKYKSALFDKYIYVNNIIKLEKEFEEIELSEEDKRKIIELSQDPKIFDKIVDSIAPSIYGLREIKEAIVLQLFGGTPGKKTPDGMPIRSDTHILLIGDPGVAKTRLLHYVRNIAPKGMYVSGKGSSAAGLTAAAEKDDFAEGGWTLKAGALVLAAGGQVMIDEFDKMSEEDRSAMHEAMETQEIHIAKAGIVTKFKANTSILAAANPKYGRFDPNMLPAEQFDIPPTIMSRFDLIFSILDDLDPAKDKAMAEHILNTHYISAHLAIGKKDVVSLEEKKILPPIDPDILRKYIAYARKEIKPILTKEAADRLQSFYVELRRMGREQNSIPITARQLEALVRLAEESAKVRLSNQVTIEDAERAIRLVLYSLKQVGIDPETGKFDIDIIATGTSKSKRDKVKIVESTIKKLNVSYDEVTYEMIAEEVESQGVKKEELEEILSMLKRNGSIYSPKYGVYKPAELQK